MRPIVVSLFAALAVTAWSGIALADEPVAGPTGSPMAFAVLGELELDASYERRVMGGVDASLASEAYELAGPSTMDCSNPRHADAEICVVTIAGTTVHPGPAALPTH